MRIPQQINVGAITPHKVSTSPFKIFDEDGNEYSHDKVAVVDRDTREVLGIHEDGYSLIKHKDVLDSFMRVVDTDIVTGKLHFGNNRTMHLYYYPPQERYAGEVEAGDIVRFGMRISNSYDGSTALRGQLIAIRLICMNGMLAHEFIKGSYHRHTRISGDLNKFEGEIKKMLDFDPQAVMAIINDSRNNIIEPLEALNVLNISQMLKDAVVHALPDTSDISAWELYSVMTDKVTRLEGEYSEKYLEKIHKEANKLLKEKELEALMEGVEDEEEAGD